MQLVQSIKEIKENIRTMDQYLAKKREPEYSYALDLVRRGVCFIAVKSGRGYKFYPSRFIGYAENTMANHENNEYKDGKETNPVISSILHQTVSPDYELECAYIEYCKNLGFTEYKKHRKYWRLA